MHKYNLLTMSCEALYYHFSIYGEHEAGVIICDKAITGDISALKYAEIIWNTYKL